MKTPTKQVNVAVSEDLANQFQGACRMRGTTMVAVLTPVLEAYVRDPALIVIQDSTESPVLGSREHIEPRLNPTTPIVNPTSRNRTLDTRPESVSVLESTSDQKVLLTEIASAVQKICRLFELHPDSARSAIATLEDVLKAEELRQHGKSESSNSGQTRRARSR